MCQTLHSIQTVHNNYMSHHVVMWGFLWRPFPYCSLCFSLVDLLLFLSLCPSHSICVVFMLFSFFLLLHILLQLIFPASLRAHIVFAQLKKRPLERLKGQSRPVSGKITCPWDEKKRRNGGGGQGGCWEGEAGECVGGEAGTHRLRCHGSRGTVASPSVHIHCSPQLGPQTPFPASQQYPAAKPFKASTKARQSNPKKKSESRVKEEYNGECWERACVTIKSKLVTRRPSLFIRWATSSEILINQMDKKGSPYLSDASKQGSQNISSSTTSIETVAKGALSRKTQIENCLDFFHKKPVDMMCYYWSDGVIFWDFHSANATTLAL